MMPTKLNFRARTLDASKPLAIYCSEDLPDLNEIQAINRSVPAMPSGMEKEEEGEKHLQDILVLQEKGAHDDRTLSTLVIPTPEVFGADAFYESVYKSGFKLPRQYLHVQPFSADHDQPDYDMDEEDEAFLNNNLRGEKKFEISEITFEDMLDRLEKNSGHNVVSPKEAKLLLKEDDELIMAVYDYWVDKRLRLKQPLIPQVKRGERDGSSGANSNPYIAFRRRTEKMQTRKNRKNDEVSYEKMLKLRRDLGRAVTLLDLVKRREKYKKENLTLTLEIFEKRYTCGDFEGKVVHDFLATQRQQQSRVLQPAYQMKYAENWLSNHHHHPASVGGSSSSMSSASNKRSYNKKKRIKTSHGVKSHHGGTGGRNSGPEFGTSVGSSDDEVSGAASVTSPDDLEDDELSAFTFKRKKNCHYLAPKLDEHGFEMAGGWPWESTADGGLAESKYRYSLASLSTPKPRCVGMIRRRVGRGGRIILDRAFHNHDEFWNSLDFNVFNRLSAEPTASDQDDVNDWPHYRPVTPPHVQEPTEGFDGQKMFRLSDSAVGLPTQPLKPCAAMINRSRTSGVHSQTKLGAGSSSSSSGSVKAISVDSLIAQNAASAVVTNDMLDIFSPGRLSSSSSSVLST